MAKITAATKESVPSEMERYLNGELCRGSVTNGVRPAAKKDTIEIAKWMLYTSSGNKAPPIAPRPPNAKSVVTGILE